MKRKQVSYGPSLELAKTDPGFIPASNNSLLRLRLLFRGGLLLFLGSGFFSLSLVQLGCLFLVLGECLLTGSLLLASGRGRFVLVAFFSILRLRLGLRLGL